MDFPLFAVPEIDPKQCRGDNREQVLVVYQVTADREDLEAFLGKILAAVQLDMEKDIALLPITPGASFSLSRLRKQVAVKKVVFFGVEPRVVGLNCTCRLYAPLAFPDFTCVFTDELETILQERQQGGKRLSSALWQSLKELFGQHA